MARSIALLGVLFVLTAAACSGTAPGAVTPPSTTVPSSSTQLTSTTGTTPQASTGSTQATTTSVAPTTLPATTIPPAPAADLSVRLEEVVQLDRPVFLTALPGDSRLFIVDQPGRIWTVDDGGRAAVLDIRDLVRFGGERGLLGMAFHPDVAANRLFYVNYTDKAGDTIIAEYALREDGTADPDTARTVLRVRQPAANHNGGMITFGDDGYLWIGMGDGGGSNNQFRTARNPNRLNGSMLRIEVGPDAPQPYGVPDDNPYVGTDSGRAEVWAIGLRNPWRFTIDRDRLYIADVGQGRIEEVSVASTLIPGPDFGWSVMEGDECFRSSDCNTSGFVAPVYTYGHGQGCSITGGVVYHGSDLPEIEGHYFFADFCSGWVRSIVVDDAGGLVEELEWPELEVGSPAGFGTDGAGEMYVLSHRGVVYKVVRNNDG